MNCIGKFTATENLGNMILAYANAASIVCFYFFLLNLQLYQIIPNYLNLTVFLLKKIRFNLVFKDILCKHNNLKFPLSILAWKQRGEQQNVLGGAVASSRHVSLTKQRHKAESRPFTRRTRTRTKATTTLARLFRGAAPTSDKEHFAAAFAPEPAPTQSRSAVHTALAFFARRAETKRHCSAKGRRAQFFFYTHLVEQLLPCGVGLDGKLQLGVHGGDAHVDLQDIREAG